jgi:branched-chain amino acid transport system ATP-binding protein
MAVVEVADVTKSFGGLTAVNHVSLEVDRGELLGLIGPNGSGKSTLLNVVSGVYKPTSGSIRVHGRETAGWRAYRVAGLGVARTFQQPRMLQEASVFHNVLVAAHGAGRHGFVAALLGGPVTRSEERALRGRAWDALEFVGLTGRAEILAGQLTAGETRLVSVARAVAAAADVVLLDEPAAGLNSAETEALRSKLLELTKRDMAVVLVDHDMPLVMEVASHIVVLDYGEVIAAGTPGEVQRNPAVIEAYLGRRAADKLAARH